jgi:hypothetical protein
MKKLPFTFCVTLALMTFARLLIAAGSEPANTDSSDVAVNPTQPAATTEPAAAPSPKTNGLKKATQPARLSFGVDEVVKMYQGGVETDVVLNYIENSSVPYHLSAEEVVHLHDLGVPSQIITTLIRHGAKVQQQANAASAVIQQKAAEEAKAASVSYNPYSPSVYAPPAPAAAYTYAYPTYVNTYPSYVYPTYYPSYYYYPRYGYSSPFYFSFSYPGYGHFYSHGGFRSYPRFGFGGHIGSGHAGFGGGFHGGRHR